MYIKKVWFQLQFDTYLVVHVIVPTSHIAVSSPIRDLQIRLQTNCASCRDFESLHRTSLIFVQCGWSDVLCSCLERISAFQIFLPLASAVSTFHVSTFNRKVHLLV